MSTTSPVPAAPEDPGSEAARIASLRSLRILDTPPEERFDRITELAALVFAVPIALVSLVDFNRQWFKSCIGLDVSETDREVSFCSHAILSAEPMIIEDAQADPRFADNALVTGPPGIRFYAGAPLSDPAGHRLGTLCVIDVRPRRPTAREIEILRKLARWAEKEVNSIGLDRTTQLLHESEDLYRSVVAAVEEGVVVRDTTGSVVACNASAERILGLPADRIVGRSLTRLPWRAVDAEGAPFGDSDSPAATALLTGQACSGVIVGLCRPDRDTTWITVNARLLIQLGESRPYASVATFADITERRAVDRMQDEFVSVVSHELRTPLASVKGALSLIADGDTGTLPAATSRMTEIALANVDRLGRMVEDILDIERLRSGHASLVTQETDAAALVRSVIAAMQPDAERAGTTLELTSDGASAVLDADRITQVLTNLLGNSIKFSWPGSAIRLSVAEEGGFAVFRVSDQGRGIPKGDLETIFGRFHQVEAADAREKGGTGLGLAICRGIIEQHGGRIWAESVEGRGSTFTFTLPLEAGAGGAATSAEAPPGGLTTTQS